MELVDQIFATVFIAILLASLVAKLFSTTLAAADDHHTIGRAVQQLNENIGCQVVTAADHFKDMKSVGGFDSEETTVLDFDHQHQDHENFAEFLDQGKLVVEECSILPGSLLLEEQAEAVESPLESSGEETIKLEGLLVGDDDEDDWEGIERSELDDNFAAAAAFVANVEKCGTLLTSDVHMQLDRLHKIATQGSCHEPQSMPLMMSARAKWNSWQRKGSMSPEVAMEQYLSLLSDKVPGWMEHNDTTL